MSFVETVHFNFILFFNDKSQQIVHFLYFTDYIFDNIY